MHDEGGDMFGFGFLIATFIALFCMMGIDGCTVKTWQGECVKRGIAEWVVNTADGKTTFKWKDEMPEKGKAQ